jgi:ribosomal protein S17
VAFNGQEVAYKLGRGPYSEAGHLFTELSGDLVREDPENHVQGLPTIGIFYDDPEKVKEVSRCRYAVGVILPSEGDPHRERLKTGLEARGYSTTSLPVIDHVVYSVFPFRGVFSILIAVKRVYPRLKQYIKEHNLCAHPCIEIYEGDKIYFIEPLSKQDQFYLFPEEEDEEDGDDDDDDSSASRSEADELGRSSQSHSESDPLEERTGTRPEATVGRKGSRGDEATDNGSNNGLSTRTSTSSSFEELRAEDVQ